MSEVRIRSFGGGVGAGGGTFSAGVSDIGNTAGTTGTVSQQLIFVGGSNVTLSQSINLQSATITIDASFNQTLQPDQYNIISAGSQIADTTGTILFQNSNSISFGMSDNSVITAQYELKSHDSVYHSGVIGAESQIAFDTLAGHDHDGVDSKLIITPQYLEVSETGGVGESGKQFTSIATAIAAAVAGGADVTKPYVIKVYPGTYTEPQLVMASYVAVIGSGMFNTIITASDLTQNFIIGATNSYIRDCAIVGPTDPATAAIYHNKISSSPFTIQDVLIRQGYYGVWADSLTTGGNVHCINVNNWYNGTVMHTFMYATNFGTIVAISCSFMCGPAGKITRGFACVGSDAEIYMDLCSFRNTPVGLPGNDAVFVDDGGKVKLVACTFSIGTNAIHIGPNGTGGYVIAVGCNIRNEPAMGYVFTTDILIDNAGTLQYTGSCTKSKITITNPPAVTFSANFTDSTSGEEGTVTIGEAWLGFSIADSIPLRDYGLTSYSSGWRGGGAVTRSGAYPSLNISVAAGSGYINTGTGVTRITWGPAATVLICTANTTEYIYVDNAGTVTISAVEPNYPDVILLVVTRTSNNHVEFLSDHNISLHQSLPTIYKYIEQIFGPVSYFGCDVTQTAGLGNELKVDFATGKYFDGLQDLQLATTSPVTFTYWYRKVGSSGWNVVTPGGGGSDFDTGLYDNNSGALVALPGGKYKKDLLFAVKNDVGTEFHVIYGQIVYDTVDQANAASGFEVPDAIESGALKIAGIVVLSGASVIAAIIDERNKFVSEHNELLELQGGDAVASQYFHLNYNEWTSRGSKIVASILTGGNTAGAMAIVSSGTMYLAGGNNVTLSQNANSITISGANVAIAAGGVTTTGSTFTFGNTSGISFLLSNGSIIGSVGAYLTSQSGLALSGSNTSFTFQTATFGASNGLSFYVTNGSMVGSYTVPVQSAEPRVISLNGTSGSLSLSGASNITVSALNGSTITIYGPSNILNSLSIGGNIGTTGSSAISGGGFVLAGGSNVTLSQSNNSISIHGLSSQSNQPRVISLNGTSGSLSLSGASNITVSALNGSTITIYGPANILNSLSISGNVGTTGSSAITGGGFVLAGGSNITLSQSNNSISIHGPNPSAAGIAAIGNTGSSNAFTSGSVIFSALSNITINTSANGGSQYIQISGLDAAAAAGVSAIANSEITYTSGLLILSGYSNITISSSVNGGSQYFRLSVVDPGGNAIRAISGSNASISDSTVTFGALNGLTFYVTNGSVVGSYTVPTQSAEPRVISLNGTSGSMSLYGASNVTISNNGSAITVYGPGNILNSFSIGGNTGTTGSSAISGGGFVLAGGSNITLSQSNATISIYGNNQGIGAIANSEVTFTSGTVNLLEGGGAITIASSVGGQSFKFSVPAQSSLAAVGNVSIATAGSTISISGMGVASLGVVGSEGTYTSGNVIFSGLANITINTTIAGGSQYIRISAPNPGAALGVSAIAGSGASTATSGLVQFQNSYGITFGLNGNTITASHNALTSQSTGVGGIYASGIATTFTSGSIGFSGSNNITISTAAQVIIISGPNTHAVQVGISSIGATNTTYTSGGVSLYGSGIISLSSTTGQGFVISAPGVVSLNGYSSALSISAGNLISISNNNSTINIINILSSSAIVRAVGSANSIGSLSSRFALADHAHAGINGLGVSNTGTTAGDTGTKVGTIVIAGSGNITVSQSTGAGINTIWLSVPAGGGGIAVSNSQSLYSSGTLNLLEGGGAITIAAGANSLKFSVPAQTNLVGVGNVSLASAGSTISISGMGVAWELEGANTSGTTSSVQGSLLYLSGGNNITLSGNSNTIIISGQEIPDFGLSNVGNTSGVTGTVNAQMILAGGNNITLSGSTNGQLITVTISAARGIILVSDYLVTASAQAISFTGANVTDNAYTFHMYISNPLNANPIYSVMFNGVSAGISRRYITENLGNVSAVSDNNAYAFNLASSENAHQVIYMMIHTTPLRLIGVGNEINFRMNQQTVRQTGTAATAVTAIVISADAANAIGPNSRIIWYKHG